MTVGSGLSISLSEKSQLRINTIIQQLIQGRSNAVGTVTLSTGTTTASTAATCGPTSAILLFPLTADACAAAPTVSVPSTNITPGQFIVNHASNANTDKTFFYFAVG